MLKVAYIFLLDPVSGLLLPTVAAVLSIFISQGVRLAVAGYIAWLIWLANTAVPISGASGNMDSLGVLIFTGFHFIVLVLVIAAIIIVAIYRYMTLEPDELSEHYNVTCVVWTIAVALIVTVETFATLGLWLRESSFVLLPHIALAGLSLALLGAWHAVRGVAGLPGLFAKTLLFTLASAFAAGTFVSLAMPAFLQWRISELAQGQPWLLYDTTKRDAPTLVGKDRIQYLTYLNAPKNRHAGHMTLVIAAQGECQFHHWSFRNLDFDTSRFRNKYMCGAVRQLRVAR